MKSRIRARARCAIYVRSATPSQSHVDVQRVACTQYAERLGFVVVATYVDSGQSGLTLRRPALARLLAGEGFDTLIVQDLDRLARMARHVSVIQRRLLACGVAIHCVAEGVGPVGPEVIRLVQTASSAGESMLSKTSIRR